MLKEMIDEVTKANQGFYEAFESLDIRQMDMRWAQEDYVTCIHPGWDVRAGWPEVRDSWVRIFNNTFSMEFRLSDIMIQVAGDIAWVLCRENIKNKQDGETQEAQVLVTNIYEKVEGRWLMVHHHGSHVM
ncbi:MAG TPA: nuclear transport factor 2 family protein [Nitrospirales bacterium]